MNTSPQTIPNYLGIKTPPTSADAEAATIGATLVDPRAYAKIAKQLGATDFWGENHRHMWRGIEAVMASEQNLDALTLIHQLDRSGHLEAAGGTKGINRLSNSMPSAANVQSYVDIVLEKSRLRTLISGMERLVSGCYADEITSGEVIGKASELVRGVTRTGGKLSSDPKDVARRILQYQEDVLSGRTTAEYTCGIPIIDRLTRWRVGQYHVIGAYSGHGKTTVCGAIASGLAYHHDAVVSWWNCEINQVFQAIRLLTPLFSKDAAGIDVLKEHWAMHPDRVPTKAQARFQNRMVEAVGWLAGSGVRIEPPGAICIRDVELTAESLRMDYPDRPLVVVVDYLQHMTLESGRRSTQGERVAECSRRLSHIAKSLDCIVIAASQFTETDYAANPPLAMPKVAQTRDSKDVRNDADAFFAYHRPWHGASSNQSIAVMEAGKDRWGLNGHVVMNADGGSNTFTSYDGPLPQTIQGLNSPRLNGGRL